MKKIAFIVILGFLFAGDLLAQQDAQYSQYMFNGLVLNPAYAGSRGGFSTTMILRKQWFGIDGSPTTASLAAHGLMGEKHGVGGHLIYDKLGLTNQVAAVGNYAFRIPFGESSHLALGIKGGIMNYQLRWSDASPDELEPGVIPNENLNKFVPLAGAGVYFHSEKFFAGVSTPNFIPNKLTNAQNVTGEVAQQVLHVFATAGVIINVGENLKIRPSTLFKYAQKAPVQFDINLSFLIKDAFWIGASYRTGDAVLLVLEYQFKNGLRVGYSYDYPLTQIRMASSGSHELMLGFDLVSKNRRALTPRLF